MQLHRLQGCLVSFEYPATGENTVTVRPRMAPRRVRVLAVRDLRREPLDPTSVAHRPALLRSRYLVQGWDLDKRETRWFYSGSASRVRVLPVDDPPEPLYRVVILHPDGRRQDRAWLPEAEALAFVRSYNASSPAFGPRAAALPIDQFTPPARSSSAEVQLSPTCS